jgi:hypothetical protein
MTLMISTADAVVPMWARRRVPRQLVDLYMDAEQAFREGAHLLGKHFVRLTPPQLEVFVSELRSQLERQLLAKAHEAEELLR